MEHRWRSAAGDKRKGIFNWRRCAAERSKTLSHTRSIPLPDGRSLAFDEAGDSSGFPVFFFHGVPGSRLYWSMAGPDDPAATAGVRLISVDRPGIGLSSAMPSRTVASFASDIIQLADGLDVGEFGCLGFSGGTPYALATAVASPERVRAVALISPVGDLGVPRLLASMDPAVRHLLNLATKSRSLLHGKLVERRDARRLISKGANQLWSTLPAADRRALARDGVRASALAAVEEAVREGLEGARLDAELLLRPWGFDLSDVRVPVEIFSGGVDPWSTDEIAHWFKRGLGSCKIHRDPGGGHFTTLAGKADRVLSALVSHAPDAQAALVPEHASVG